MTSLATATPNVPVMTAERVHTVKRGARVGWRCSAKFCPFTTEDDNDAMQHAIRNQWISRGPLPPELQLTAEQEAA